MTITCPYGGELKPNVEPYVYGYEIAAQIAEQFIEVPFLGNLVDALDWVLFDVQWVADHGPFEYPSLDIDDVKDQIVFVDLLKDYFNAWLWDQFCQCAARPGG